MDCFWYGEIFRGNFVARGTKVLEKLPIVKIDFNNESEKALHDQIASLQEVLIQLQGQIDQNAGNQRELIPFQRQFDNKKTELDEALKSLFNLGEDDNLIPLISELYAAH